MNIIEMIMQALRESEVEVPTPDGVSEQNREDIETILSNYCKVGNVSMHFDATFFGIPVESAVKINYAEADKEVLLRVIKAMVSLSKANQ